MNFQQEYKPLVDQIELQIRCPQPRPRPTTRLPFPPFTRVVYVDGKHEEAANVWRDLRLEVWNDRAKLLAERHPFLPRTQIIMCSRWWEEPRKMMHLIAEFHALNKVRGENLKAAGITRNIFRARHEYMEDHCFADYFYFQNANA